MTLFPLDCQTAIPANHSWCAHLSRRQRLGGLAATKSTEKGCISDNIYAYIWRGFHKIKQNIVWVFYSLAF